MDYGLRFVHATPQQDKLLQSGNFLPDKWAASAAPTLYVPACANGAATCTGTNRAAKNPLTGQILGPNTSLAVGTLVPNSGDGAQRPVPVGQGNRRVDVSSSRS